MTVATPAIVVANLSNWLRRDGNVATAVTRAIGIGWALVMAYVLCIAAREHDLVLTARHECITDPRNFLRAGELLERDTLRFLVRAHCMHAKYLSDGWIELPYEGTVLGVQTSQFTVAGAIYYKLVWVGGIAAP